MNSGLGCKVTNDRDLFNIQIKFRRYKMTNKYKNEGSKRNKILVPVVVLMLCAMAMIGLGYSAFTSTVTNQANLITGEGLEAELRIDSDTSDTLLKGTEFSKGAIKLNFGSKQTDDVKTYYVDKVEGQKIGGAKLFLKTYDSDITSVTITYAVTFKEAGTEDATPYDLEITHGLKIGTGTPEVSQTVAVDADGSIYDIELIADIEAKDGIVNIPTGLTYDITITVTPVTP